jgi:prolyl 4-hydroxylase
MNTMADADVDTQFRTGMAMLAGTSLSPDWERAVGLIDSAAAAGHAEAIERRALLECRGVGRAANWDKALDSLVIAAERGSQSAARQLILLAEDRYDPAAATVPPPGDWTELRSRISIAQRVRAATSPGRILSARPIVHAVPDFGSAAECQWLIAAAAPRLTRAGVYNSPTGVDPGRTNQFALFNFANADLIVEVIR